MTSSPPAPPASSWLRHLVRRWLLPAVMLLTFLFGLLGAVRLGSSLGEPFPGFMLLWRKEYKLLTVSSLTPPNWSGPGAGMKINDRILCINGYSPKPDSPVYGLDPRYAEHPCPNGSKNFAVIYREAFQSADPTVNFLIDRDGVIQTITNVPLERFDLALLVETFAPAFLLGLALLVLGWVVYHANPDYEINLVFTQVMVITSNFAFNTTLAGLITDNQFETGLITMVQIVPWLALLGPLTFHLAELLSSPGSLSTAAQFIRHPYYWLAVVFSIVGVTAYFFNKIQFSQTLNTAYLYWLGFSWVFSTVWALVSLGLTYRKTTQRRVRMQTGFVLGAIALTVVICIPFAGLFIANQLTFPYMQGIPYVGLVVVAMIAYAILRYQLFAARTLTLTFLLVLVASVLAALLVYLPVGNDIGFVPLLGSSLLAGSVFAGRFKPFGFLNRLLHREELDYQAAARFSQNIRQPQSAVRLAEASASALKDELETEQVELWLFSPDQPVVEHFFDRLPVETAALDPALTDQVRQMDGPVYAESPAGVSLARGLSNGSPLSPHGLWVPLIDREQALGLLYIGPRWTGEVYGEEDLRLVRLLTVPLGLALANIFQVERLRAMQRQILQAEENERYKIARELHDTVLQFLLVLTFGLDGMKENPLKLDDRIEDWQGRISAEASRLRDLLSYLRTPETLEQRGLTTSLEQLFEDMRRQTTTRIVWEIDPQVEPGLAPETKVALYRVLREAVNNALKYARAQQVSICLQVQDGRLDFSVQDDGQGFEVQPALKSAGKGYSSLQDMRIYVESTGGKLDIQSTPGKGTLIQGWMPALPIN